MDLTRREFLQTAGIGLVAAGTIFVPFVSKPWRVLHELSALRYQIEGDIACQAQWLIPRALTRWRVRWDEIEIEPGVYDWSRLDEDVQRLREAEAKLMLNLICTPRFYRMDAEIRCSPPRQAFFWQLGDFATTLAKRYQPEVIELWNEPEVTARAGGQ